MLAAAERARLAARQTETLQGGELQIATVRSLAVRRGVGTGRARFRSTWSSTGFESA